MRWFIFLMILYGVSYSFLINKPEKHLFSHIIIKIGNPFICKYSGPIELFNNETNPSYQGAVLLDNSVLGTHQIEHLVHDIQLQGGKMAVFASNGTTDSELRSFQFPAVNKTLTTNITICSILVGRDAYSTIRRLVTSDQLDITVNNKGELQSTAHIITLYTMSFLLVVMIVCYSLLHYYFSNAMIRKRVVQRMKDRVDLIPTCVYSGSPVYEPCCICLTEFCKGDHISILPCGHCFHHSCLVPWLGERSNRCPICKACPYRGKDIETGSVDHMKEIEKEVELKKLFIHTCGQYLSIFIIVLILGLIVI